MDRPRLVTDDYQYNPIHTGADWRGRLKKASGPLVAAAVALAKWSFVLVKFGSIFIAVGAYTLIWGWKFAVGIVALITVHEMGHYIEARREGLSPKLPMHIPFLGAYVRYTRGHPWQTARIAIAGPIFGGVGALVCLAAGSYYDSNLFRALAYFGFFLNLINLIPVSPLDGGAALQSARWLRLGGGRSKAFVVYGLYAVTAVALAAGMFSSYVHQHRL